ncbi:MAG: hypothetical protein Q9225_007146 [Loekoesia sp. 1 TL-2023]
MTSNWREGDHQDCFELTTRRPRRHIKSDPAEDLNPESDASLLKRHLEEASHDGDEADAERTDLPNPNVWQRLFTLMSRIPLFSRSNPGVDETSYGAIPTRDNNSDDGISDSNEGSFKDFRKQDKRKTHVPQSRSSSESSYGFEGQSSTANYRIAKDGTGEDDVIPISGQSTDEDENPPDNSRYLQVRASVSAKDDVAASISTPRMWTLSLLCALLGSGTNLFFSLRYPSIAITPIIALVVVHPLGLAWDRLFKRDDDPIVIYEYGQRVKRSVGERSRPLSGLTRVRQWFAQGKWNEKEHALSSSKRNSTSKI